MKADSPYTTVIISYRATHGQTLQQSYRLAYLPFTSYLDPAIFWTCLHYNVFQGVLKHTKEQLQNRGMHRKKHFELDMHLISLFAYWQKRCSYFLLKSGTRYFILFIPRQTRYLRLARRHQISQDLHDHCIFSLNIWLRFLGWSGGIPGHAAPLAMV